jgi:hypothetical protein
MLWFHNKLFGLDKKNTRSKRAKKVEAKVEEVAAEV